MLVLDKSIFMKKIFKKVILQSKIEVKQNES
jgi:hypothetical protein